MVPIGTIILQVMADLSSHFKKGYIYPSQNTLVRLVEDRSGISISRRTLNRRLSELETDGYFMRIKRHTNNGQGKILLRSTLYILKKAFFSWVHRLIGKAKKWSRFFRVPAVAQYNLQTSYIQPSSAISTPSQTFKNPPEEQPKRTSFNDLDFKEYLDKLESKFFGEKE